MEEEIKKTEEENAPNKEQDVKEEMQKESEVFNTVLDEWDDSESPLKDTFQVKVKNVDQISNTANRIEKITKVNAVRYGEGMVDKMISAFSSVEKVTYGVVIALVIVTVFLIINTIKLTISARRREIGIMRLLIKPEPFIYSTAGIVVIIGILVFMVGSAGAVRKYLKI